MLKAYNHHLAQPDQNLYAVFAQGVKFQYPPSSLLPCALLPADWRVVPDNRILNLSLLRLLNWLSRSAILGTWLVVAQLAVIARRRLSVGAAATKFDEALIFLLALPLAAGFYPVIHAYRLGQVQVFLNFAVGLALLVFLVERRALAGAILAACTLVKPQFCLVLLWSLLRREKRFTLGYGVTLGVGLGLSLWHFGFADHLAYLDVLREIGRLGESAYLNQSVNGLLNRLGNGVVAPAPGSLQSEFAPYHLGIHLLTNATSTVIVLLALEPWHWRRASYGILDLAIVLGAATMASPVAWNHHYGLFVYIFPVVMPLALFSMQGALKGSVLGVSFLLLGLEFASIDWFLETRWRMLLLSHVFFGAVLLFWLLLRVRQEQATSELADTRLSALSQ